MDLLHKPGYVSKYAAVTFSTTATVNFKFLPYSSAASQITTISYPGESTNTQAGLREAKNLFDDPYSGKSSHSVAYGLLLPVFEKIFALNLFWFVQNVVLVIRVRR